MKNKLILSLALFLGLFSSCTNPDDDQINTSSDINGEWSLVNISGGEAGVDNSFDQGLIKWNIETEMLTIENNNSSEDYDAYDSGNYLISVSEVEEELYLVFDGREYGKIEISQNEMIIDQHFRSYGTYNDVFVLKFRK